MNQRRPANSRLAKFLTKIDLKQIPLLVLVAIVFIVGFVICGSLFMNGKEDGKQAVMLLFLLPAALFAIVSWRGAIVGGILCLLMLLCLGSYLVFWAMYFTDWFNESTYLICLFISAVLGSIAFIFTWLMMRPDPDADSESLLEDLFGKVKDDPFLTVYFSLGLFLCVAYNLSFALAFHDKSGNADEVRLFAEAIPKPASSDPPGELIEGDKDDFYARILFGERLSAVESDGKLGWDKNNEVWDLKLAESLAEPERGFIVIWNNKELDRVKNYLIKVGRSVKVHFRLLGHANAKPVTDPKTSFGSNFELSIARYASVFDRLLSIIHKLDEPPERSWNVVPRSNEGRFHADVVNNTNVKVDMTRSAEIVVQEFRGDGPPTIPGVGRKLFLLDYVYFTIYTVTTTGYGDIIPVSSEAKLISSIGNYFELFFGVVIFNALLSAITRRRAGQLHESVREIGSELSGATEKAKKEVLASVESSRRYARSLRSLITKNFKQLSTKLDEKPDETPAKKDLEELAGAFSSMRSAFREMERKMKPPPEADGQH